MLVRMSDVTHLLDAAAAGDQTAADSLPAVYAELRRRRLPAGRTHSSAHRPGP